MTAVSTSAVAAQSLDFKLVNLSSGDVVEFYVSHSGTNEWEENLLDGAYLPSGNEIDVSIDDNRKSCSYDIRAVFGDGADLADYQINFCDVTQYVIEDGQTAPTRPSAGDPATHLRQQFDTPAAVFKSAQSALRHGDMDGFFLCLTPSSLTDYAVNLAGVMGMTVAFADLMEGEQHSDMMQIRAVLDRHGLTEDFYHSMNNSTESSEAVRQVIAESIADKYAFITEIHATLAAVSGEAPSGGALAYFDKSVRLDDYQITGEQAAGTVTIDGEKQSISFKRVDGSWLLDI